ncbi:EF-hand [Xylaria nigripes]|nr:EF-hand [Xylaria nigripes]
MSTGYKPSPLGYGSTRSSPFRRPGSPTSSPSPLANRQFTPTSTPTKISSLCTPSRLAAPSVITTPITTPITNTTAATAAATATSTPTQESEIRTPRNRVASASVDTVTTPTPTPQTPDHKPAAAAPMSSSVATTSPQPIGHSSNALSQLLPAQVRVLRDSFQIMDRDSDGIVSREDVIDMLTQLGLSAKPSDISQFFPPGSSPNLTLAAFLNSIATPLAALSPASELLSAFSAFDDDDSGQVDVAELRDALLRTPPEPGEHVLTAAEVDKIIAGFRGRRAFSKSSMTGGGAVVAPRRGEVFRYQEFVNSITGVGGAPEPNSNEDSQD